MRYKTGNDKQPVLVGNDNDAARFQKWADQLVAIEKFGRPAAKQAAKKAREGLSELAANISEPKPNG